MKHIEVSKKINLSQKIEADSLKEILIERLAHALDIEVVSGEGAQFKLTGTTGSPAGIARHARLDLDVSVKLDDAVARIIISGFARPARSLTLLYSTLFFFLLLVGLLPGFVETSAENSGPVDALVFLIFGIYIVMDVNKKLSEPKELLESALESLDTTFG
ncbi:MAG: hypothetical protein H6868_00965 [Rhodospirillales bacterium]|nr:hypothetical protein [Rhodospirillales bacterium]